MEHTRDCSDEIVDEIKAVWYNFSLKLNAKICLWKNKLVRVKFEFKKKAEQWRIFYFTKTSSQIIFYL